MGGGEVEWVYGGGDPEELDGSFGLHFSGWICAGLDPFGAISIEVAEGGKSSGLYEWRWEKT